MKSIFNFQFSIFNYKKGFTLIELLVVIGIIGILTTFLVANFVGVKERARDAQRKSDLRNIQAALEIFRSDQGLYPTNAEFPPTCGSAVSFVFLGSTYMQSVPCDPLNTSPFTYEYTETNGNYTLISCLENQQDSQKDATNDGSKCDGGSTNWSFTLTNP